MHELFNAIKLTYDYPIYFKMLYWFCLWQYTGADIEYIRFLLLWRKFIITWVLHLLWDIILILSLTVNWRWYRVYYVSFAMEKIHSRVSFLNVSMPELASKDLQDVELSFQAVENFRLFSGRLGLYMLHLTVRFWLTSNVSVIFWLR